jgi:hypothetical protein
MLARDRHGVAVLALALGAVLLATGCKKKPATETEAAQPAPDPNKPGPQDPTVPGKPGADTKSPAHAVELSDLKVTILGPKAFRVTVKYRFTQGGPVAEDWYMVNVAHPNGAAILATQQGKELKPEGVLQQDFLLLKAIQPGDKLTYSAKVHQGPSKGRYPNMVSNVLEGSVTYQP